MHRHASPFFRNELLALPASNFRATRCWLSQNLKDPASDAEKECWKDKLLSEKLQVDDLDDAGGYYKSLGCSKVSSDYDIKQAFRQATVDFKEIARRHHPDKRASGDVESQRLFDNAKTKFDFQKQAMDVIGTPGAPDPALGIGYPERVKYDRECEALREKFASAFKTAYSNLSFADRAAQRAKESERASVYAKKVETEVKNKSLSNLERLLQVWEKHGQQTNRVRQCFMDAVSYDNLSLSDIARKVRLKAYATGKNPWN